MDHPILVYNSLSRKKEEFKPLNPPHVGLYVCGPTVYGDPHLGHARPYVTFDLFKRYLTSKGFKVRYVRNITDVGHLVNDGDEGEDKIAKKAKIEKLEPMEIVQHYTLSFREAMRQLNNQPPSIEPVASGHIIEQIELTKSILENGYAYEVNGSVYFDVQKYNEDHPYGVLSGRKLEDMMANTRALDGQDDKRNPVDFALWKKAAPEHIMRWPSPWSDGFPGWHLECTAMSTKYLGETFDVHGGGMDLQFPHHEAEIAQSVGACSKAPAKYWMHNNMITIEGQKMGKSLGNFITLEELFTGNHKKLKQAYSPETIRFYILTAHYRSTLDFSNDALLAAEKGLDRLLSAELLINDLKASKSNDGNVAEIISQIDQALADDLNSPIAISHAFELVKWINGSKNGTFALDHENLGLLKDFFSDFLFNTLGLKPKQEEKSEDGLTEPLMQLVLELRQNAKENKNWALADKIRDHLSSEGVQIKDGKDGSSWSVEK